MSDEKRCDCCKRYWYVDDLVSGLCPNCLDFLATKNQMDIEQDQKIKDLEHRLSNCIEPKFNLNSIVCYVSKKTGVVITHCTIDKIKVVGIKERFFTNLKFQYKLTYNKRYFDEEELFATEEEAKAKLEELKNG